MSDVHARSLACIEALRDITVATVYGPGLIQLGVTAAISAAADYAPARALSHRIWSSSSADGLSYKCRHDNSELALALFARAESALHVVHDAPLGQDHAWIGGLSRKYGFALEA
jgi:hypothetical protein